MCQSLYEGFGCVSVIQLRPLSNTLYETYVSHDNCGLGSLPYTSEDGCVKSVSNLTCSRLISHNLAPGCL